MRPFARADCHDNCGHYRLEQQFSMAIEVCLSWNHFAIGRFICLLFLDFRGPEVIDFPKNRLRRGRLLPQPHLDQKG